MKYVIVSTLSEMNKLEEIRKIVNNIKSQETSFYLNEMQKGTVVPVAVIIDDEIIGGVYISCSMSSLFIENIFVQKDYQGRGIASSLINYVIKNKSIFEEHFERKFTLSKLEPNSDSIISFYRKLGYSEPNELNVMKRSA